MGRHAPQHLEPGTREWWRVVASSYELQETDLRVLTAAAEAWDRLQQARGVLDRDGLTYSDRFGSPRPRPEVAIERDSRIAFARLVRELNLDNEPDGGG